MNGVSCFVVGEGGLVLSCLQVLVEQGCDVLGVASVDRSAQAWAEARGIAYIADRSTFEKQLLSSEYDYLFSIKNILPARCRFASKFRMESPSLNFKRDWKRR
jgi:D-arabinose 1-dehydrogenase-like Zn-dependent alcohol dehydrogenase